MSTTRDQPAAVALDVRDGVEAVVLDFIQPVGMVEGFGDAEQGIG
jgi:hypothetical protein